MKMVTNDNIGSGKDNQNLKDVFCEFYKYNFNYDQKETYISFMQFIFDLTLPNRVFAKV